jgi:hypothetical protein
MDLKPATFACPTHKHDLTELVRQALEEAGPPVAYRRGATRPFEVIVTCPGTSPDSAHQLTCTGDYRP